MSDETPTWRDINKIELRGRLGRDPETRTLQSGRQVASISVATSEVWKDKHSGERKERTQWHRVTTFEDVHINTLLGMAKGQRIHLSGQMTYRKYTDQSGAERETAEVTVGRFDKLDVVPDDRQPARDRQAAAPQPAREAPPGRGGAAESDEIPFSACKE